MRSFTKGFRGAWFRCKILNIRRESNAMSVSLDHADFLGEAIAWTEVYEKVAPTRGRKPKDEKRELMVRPSFPRVFRQSQVPDSYALLEELVIVRDTWKVGDLVDWWKDDCYWYGKVKRILKNKKVKIELAPPPLGEGKTYDAFCKDLRPSLNWSPIDGWTMPSANGGVKSNCGCLLKPATPVLAAGQTYDFAIHPPREGRENIDTISCTPAPNETPSLVLQPTPEKGAETSPRALLGLSPSRSEVKSTLEADVPFKKWKASRGGAYDLISPAPEGGGKKLNTTARVSTDHNFSNPSHSLPRSSPPEPRERQPKEMPAPVMQAIIEKEVVTSLEALVDHSPLPIHVSEESLPSQSEATQALEAADLFKRRKVDEDLFAGRAYDLNAPGPNGGPNDPDLSNPLPPEPSEGQLNETPTPVMKKITEKGVVTSSGASIGHLSPICVSEVSLPHLSEVKRPLESAELSKRRKVDRGMQERPEENPVEKNLSITAPNETQWSPAIKEKAEGKIPYPRDGRKNRSATAGLGIDLNFPPPEPIKAETVDQNLSINEMGAPVMQAISETEVKTEPESLVDDTPLGVSEGSLREQPLGAAESIKKGNVGRGIPFNGIQPHTVEDTIVDFEELLNRVKWAKKVLRTRILSNTAGPSWRFVNPRASSSTPK